MQQRSAQQAISGCAIAVMAKASLPGRAKTRLMPPLSAEEAAGFNTAFLKDIADNLIDAARFANISGWMAYAPAGSAQFFQDILPDQIGLIETAARDFGVCLDLALTSLLATGHASACVLNCDSPTLPTGSH